MDLGSAGQSDSLWAFSLCRPFTCTKMLHKVIRGVML